jgi:hypothetical protein
LIGRVTSEWMTLVEAQGSDVCTAERGLFGEIAAAPPFRRGRGAAARIVESLTAERPNPAGRRTMRVEFRPLGRHARAIRDPLDGQSKPAWRVALALLFACFQRIGGFSTADDEAVRKWADAFAAYDPEELLGAIDAKAESLQADTEEERRAKRIFVPHPARFVDPAILERWIELSPRGRQLAAARQRREFAPRLDAIALAHGNKTPSSPCLCASVVPLADERPLIRRAFAEQPGNTAVWEALGERRQRIIARALAEPRGDYASFLKQLAGVPDALAALRYAFARELAEQTWPEANYRSVFLAALPVAKEGDRVRSPDHCRDPAALAVGAGRNTRGSIAS